MDCSVYWTILTDIVVGNVVMKCITTKGNAHAAFYVMTYDRCILRTVFMDIWSLLMQTPTA